jgi:amino acid adenylation domain-containing protein
MKVQTLLEEFRARDIWVWADGDRLQCSTPAGVPPFEVRDLLRQRKNEILDFLRGPAPLSFSQQRLWLLEQIAPGGAAYVIAGGMELRGALDVGVLERTLAALVNRHDSLRTLFVNAEGEPLQVVVEPGSWSLPVTDLSAERQPRERLKGLLREESSRGFDLARGPLFRAQLYRLGSDTHVLMLAMHHIVSDGWSLGVMFRELGELYRSLALGKASTLPALRVQYRDFARWQRGWLKGELLERELGHWRERLEGAPQVLELPADRARPAVESHRGAFHAFSMPRELVDQLRALARREGATLFMTLLSGFALLLARYSGQQDLLIGSPVANRNRAEIEGLIGFFVNTLVLRADVSGEPTVREFIGCMREVCLDAYAHQDLPFERLVEELRPARDMSRNPVFQVAFALQNLPQGVLELPGLTLQSVDVGAGAAQFDLSLQTWETPEGLTGHFSYATDLFDEPTIARMGVHWRRLLDGMVADPEQHVSGLPMLGEAERRQLLVEWNKTDAEYPANVLIHELFEEQAVRSPDAIALVFEGQSLTYGQLNSRANRLARYLLESEVSAETLVGVCMERGIDLITSILAIFKAGAVYMPLDPGYPESRLRFMLEDTGVRLVLTHRRLADPLSNYQGTVVHIDSDWPKIASGSAENLGPRATPESLAYLIYTSGSTGNPKGARLAHRGLCNVSREQIRLFGVGPGSRVLQFSSPNFDASIFEIVMALTTGATLVLAGKEELQPGPPLSRLLREQRITILTIPPSSLNVLEPEPLPDLRAINVAGEPCPADLVSRWAPGRDFYNLYGPTECTIWATASKCVPDGGAPHIGRPIANTRVYVLDPHGNPQPVGVAGELYIGGVGVGRGYLKRPELTAEKFIADPFDTTPGARLYRTGDLVRYLPDGNIEFLGRIDSQVKLRGFRIELGEIESVLQQHPAVREVVVLAREDAPGDKRLVAYIVTSNPPADFLDQLRARLRASLPEYMVPSAFVTLDNLPLTPNGKVDRSALPAPRAERQIGRALVAARSQLEQRIAKVWCEMLHLEKVGVTDNFFDLGGHSLLLMKTHARLRAELHCELKVVDLFTYPTVEALAKYLGDETWTGGFSEEALARVKRRHSDSKQVESIAIIGMAGRFPGAGDIESFWANLREGRESIAFFSKEELRESGVSEETLNDPNYVGARGYLEDADKFDATFFGYSAREAEIIDPQQRLLLQCAAETLERAGYDPHRYGGLVGVYAGSSTNGYLSSVQAQHDGMSSVLGSGQDFLTTRISYKLNLRGPSMNVQTACSTSLVAVHQACRALWDYECDMALAGGVSVTLPLKYGYIYVQEGILSPDGHCRAFDAGANGTVGGNAVAMVMLKRLSEALADGDHIHAVIGGSAINNDGSSKVGYAAPSVEGQAQVIALAQADAQFDPGTIGYVEAHGTGTLLGDPIEVSALARVFGDGRGRLSPCWLGSLKTNVGHLDAAAGVAGLIKAALSLEHKELVPSLNFSKPNPQIDFAAGPFRVNTELRPWESPPGTARRAGVSSFGIGGTNVHVVLEEAPALEPSGSSRAWQLLCLSAKTAAALDQVAANLARHLSEHPDINFADAAYTLQVGRRELAHRCVVVCRNIADAATALESGTKERVIGGVHKGGNRSVVFMFSGQGAQYPNMGLGLYRTEVVFREVVDQCCDRLKPRLGLDLRDVLFPAGVALEQAAEQLRRTELTQPALFVIEYALARLWMSLGIQPSAMIGHSIGEYVAACLAGVMSLEDALDLVAERGRLMGQLPPGTMLAVPLSEAEVLPLLSEQLSIASINSPNLCVVSGPETEIAALETRLIKMELTPRRLHTSHAFHSFMMAPILGPFTQRVSTVTLHPPRVPYISNVTGEWIAAEQATDPAYYATHLRQPVQFAKGLEQLFADPNQVFLEVGPGNTLTTLAKRHPANKGEHAFIASLRYPDESRADEAVLMESVGRLWLAGVRPDWLALHAEQRRRRVRLPTYPFERERYWIAPSRSSGGTERIRRRADPGEWIYVPSWKRAPVPSSDPGKRGAHWLIFVDQHGLGSRLGVELIAGGAKVASVAIGERFGKSGPGIYALNPSAREDYDQLVAELKKDSLIPEFIAHLWAISRDEELREDADFREECKDRGFFSVVFLAQALEAGGLNDPLGLAVLTSHAHEVSGVELVCPEKAMALGPCKVIGMEQPHILARSIDVTIDGDLSWLARTLASDLCSTWSEQVVSYRGRYRWVQGYEQVRTDALAGPPITLREGGVYMISGGLGRIGLEVAEYLARTVRARLVLVSRNPLPAKEQWAQWLATHDENDPTSRKIQRVQAIEATGAVVLVCQADVADERQMGAAIAAAEARFGQLRGVMHAAGAGGRLVPIQSLQRSDCEEPFRPRLQGLRVLDSLLRDRRLDFCLVHSSLASVMGVMEYVSYTASHLFMDAFTYQANLKNGTPWKTVNWDIWGRRNAGTASQTEFYMNPREATDVLGRLLSMTDAAQILVSTAELQGRIDQWIRREERGVEGVGAVENTPAAQAHSRPTLSTEYEAPRTDVERLLAGIWQDVLGIDHVGIQDDFFELGADSILSFQVIAKARKAGLRLTPKQIFQHKTIAELAVVAEKLAGPVAEQGLVTGDITSAEAKQVPLLEVSQARNSELENSRKKNVGLSNAIEMLGLD